MTLHERLHEAYEHLIDNIEHLVDKEGKTLKEAFAEGQEKLSELGEEIEDLSEHMKLADAEVLIFGNPKMGTGIQVLKQLYDLEDCKVIAKVETALDKMTTVISQ